MKEKKTVEETSFTAQMDTKRKKLLNLKDTIDHNKELFQAKVNKNKYMEEMSRKLILEQKNAIQERGENPNFILPHRSSLDS